MNAKIVGTRPLRVEGSFITAALRADATPYETAARAGMTLTATQIAAILDGRARIEGDSIDGFEYVEER